jgi:hypothetical protein
MTYFTDPADGCRAAQSYMVNQTPERGGWTEDAWLDVLHNLVGRVRFAVLSLSLSRLFVCPHRSRLFSLVSGRFHGGGGGPLLTLLSETVCVCVCV